MGSYRPGIMLDFIGTVAVHVHVLLIIIRAEVSVKEVVEDGSATEGVSGDWG